MILWNVFVAKIVEVKNSRVHFYSIFQISWLLPRYWWAAVKLLYAQLMFYI